MNAQAEEVAAAAEAPTAKNVEVVSMTDGRKVEFAGKRKLIKDSILEIPGTVQVRLDFRNGETRLFTVPPSLMDKFAAHGAEQKLGDETAGTEDVDDMVLDVDALIEQLVAGKWTNRREGGGMSGTTVLIKALMEYGNRTIEQVKEFLKGKSGPDKIALSNSKKLKPIIDRLEAEKAAKGSKIDTDSLLEGFASAEVAQPTA